MQFFSPPRRRVKLVQAGRRQRRATDCGLQGHCPGRPSLDIRPIDTNPKADVVLRLDYSTVSTRPSAHPLEPTGGATFSPAPRSSPALLPTPR